MMRKTVVVVCVDPSTGHGKNFCVHNSTPVIAMQKVSDAKGLHVVGYYIVRTEAEAIQASRYDHA